MADRHTIIQTQVITDWSVQKRGRLFICSQGTFRAMHSDAVITVCPYPKKRNGFPDLFGFEFVTLCDLAKDDIGSDPINELCLIMDCGCCGFNRKVPIHCLIEVKTKKYPKLTQGQQDHLNYCVSIGGRAYVARESDNEYDLIEWTVT